MDFLCGTLTIYTVDIPYIYLQANNPRLSQCFFLRTFLTFSDYIVTNWEGGGQMWAMS
jgi:hypothetical protein